MAIQVNGTTVIGNSRDLSNIASIDATTEAAITSAGFTKTTGTVTGVTAGSGITGGGTSGTVTINHADTSGQGSINNSGNTVIQDISVDTYGHITSMTSKTISTTPPTGFNGVGTYGLFYTTSTRSSNSTLAGSSLDPSGANSFYKETGTTVSGTWRCMGHSQSGFSGSDVTVWVRIS